MACRGAFRGWGLHSRLLSRTLGVGEGPEEGAPLRRWRSVLSAARAALPRASPPLATAVPAAAAAA